jgi:hypothetical protein
MHPSILRSGSRSSAHILAFLKRKRDGDVTRDDSPKTSNPCGFPRSNPAQACVACDAFLPAFFHCLSGDAAGRFASMSVRWGVSYFGTRCCQSRPTRAAARERDFLAEHSRVTGFRPDIEGLRGIAVLIVVAFHCGIPGFQGGFVGVDVFFVLSGYLITGLLVKRDSTILPTEPTEFLCASCSPFAAGMRSHALGHPHCGAFLLAPAELSFAGRAAACHGTLHQQSLFCEKCCRLFCPECAIKSHVTHMVARGGGTVLLVLATPDHVGAADAINASTRHGAVKRDARFTSRLRLVHSAQWHICLLPAARKSVGIRHWRAGRLTPARPLEDFREDVVGRRLDRSLADSRLRALSQRAQTFLA